MNHATLAIIVLVIAVLFSLGSALCVFIFMDKEFLYRNNVNGVQFKVIEHFGDEVLVMRMDIKVRMLIPVKEFEARYTPISEAENGKKSA
jgi:hypothetical protein